MCELGIYIYIVLAGEVEYIVDTVLDQLIASVVVGQSVTKSRPRQCHHCHRLLSHLEHNGIGGGVNLCNSEHYELCPGGRKTEKGWTGCQTTDEDTDMDERLESGNAALSSDKVQAVTSPNMFSTEGKPAGELNKETRATKLDPSVLSDADKFAVSKADQVVLDESFED